LVADGLTNEEVGHALGVTSKTVEAHLGRIFERTGIQSRTELATRAIREAWLDLPVV
jgi:DNA-binding NarL/FixJ family response regulator